MENPLSNPENIQGNPKWDIRKKLGTPFHTQPSGPKDSGVYQFGEILLEMNDCRMVKNVENLTTEEIGQEMGGN